MFYNHNVVYLFILTHMDDDLFVCGWLVFTLFWSLLYPLSVVVWSLAGGWVELSNKSGGIWYPRLRDQIVIWCGNNRIYFCHCSIMENDLISDGIVRARWSTALRYWAGTGSVVVSHNWASTGPVTFACRVFPVIATENHRSDNIDILADTRW